MAKGLGEAGDRFQVRLVDLFIVVLGASYVLDVARRSRIAWGGGWPDFAHAVGLTVLTFGVTVTLVLVVQWAARLKRKEGRAWAATWRVVAVGWLAGSLVEVAAVLQVSSVPATGLIGSMLDPLRLRLDSLCAMLGMVGLVLAVMPLGPRSGRVPPHSRWGSLPAVLWSVVVGIMLLALGHGMFPYLVLLALEAVHNAMRLAPVVERPIVFDRMMTASLESLPGLIGCLLTATWVDDDSRAAVRDPSEARRRRPWWVWSARASTVLLAGAGGVYVVTVSIPKLSPPLAEGLAAVVDPSQVATVSLGFAALAAGLAARSAAHLAHATVPDDPSISEVAPRTPNPWPGRMIGGVFGLFCLEITLAAVQSIQGDIENRWYVPIDFPTWKSILQIPESWLIVPSGHSAWNRVVENPDDLLIGIAALWLTVRLIGLITGKRPGSHAPMDVLATDRKALGRFFGWWVALTTAMLACMPGLAIVSVTLLHHVIRWTAK